jgi:seryl-tRNA synthetase
MTMRTGASAPAAGAPPQMDPRDARVDGICDKILAELRVAPEVVKEIFRKPEETIAALRTTCRDLTRRERDVRKFLSPEEDLRLSREHDALRQRVETESDEVAKLRLSSALAALEQQRDQRQELSRSAARFEAEHTRISYTLESLYTQIVRMRSADSASVDVAGAGLRRSLDMLSEEVNALADALEKVNRGEAAKMKKVAEGPAAGEGAAPPAAGRREKA